MAEFDYLTIDVFTKRRFGGNPLAVFPRAEGLDTGMMQALAAELNYSETTFVLPPEDPANTARVRIFNRTAEMPFAGHPNVGTAYVLARHGHAQGQTLRFEEVGGLVDVRLIEQDGGAIGDPSYDGGTGARMFQVSAFSRSRWVVSKPLTALAKSGAFTPPA